ncbi:diadenylate cyclase CdaA [Candidatus Sumerlaeota bacterium]
MRDLQIILTNMQWTDWLDIFLVAALFYVILSVLRRTRSALAMRGLASALIISFISYFIARFANLSALTLIFETFWLIAVIIFIVVFQNDIRTALIELGRVRLFRAFFSSSQEYIDEISRAVSSMANKKVGLLIALERRESLKVYADTGTPLDAGITCEILQTIFTPYTPLHDGAVIVRNERLVAAGAILPLSESTTMSKDLGTRHRAALGLSEETDAPVIIVSEETGIISIALNGRLERSLTPAELKSSLIELMDTEGAK